MNRTGPVTQTDAEAQHVPGLAEQTGLEVSGVFGPLKVAEPPVRLAELATQPRVALLTEADAESVIGTRVGMGPFLAGPLLVYGDLLWLDLVPDLWGGVVMVPM